MTTKQATFWYFTESHKIHQKNNKIPPQDQKSLLQNLTKMIHLTFQTGELTNTTILLCFLKHLCF